MFMLRQTSVKMVVLLHKQAKVPFIQIIAVWTDRLTDFSQQILFENICDIFRSTNVGQR